MKASQFHSLMKASGERYLSADGWQYRQNIWQFEGEDYYLALVPADTKYGMGFQIKYLTLTLIHTAVNCPGGERPKPFSNNDQLCPVQISPKRLKKYVANGYSDWVWHRVLPHQNRLTINAAYFPVYYGGKDKQLLAQNASTWQNRWMLRSSIRAGRTNVISEEEVAERVELLVKQCAEYGTVWAEQMTPREVMRQLTYYGDKYHAPNWLRAYEAAFPDMTQPSETPRKQPSLSLRLRNRLIGF